jgi:hypothetical protein
MGADVAASPHCPVAGILAFRLERCAPGSFEGRSSANGSTSILPGSRSRLAPGSVFPRAHRSGPGTLAVRRSADQEFASLFSPLPRPEVRYLGSFRQRDPRPKPRFRLTGCGSRPSSLPSFAAPGPKPGPARRSGQARSPVTLRRLSSRLGRTDRETFTPLLPAARSGPSTRINRLGAFGAGRLSIR